MFPFAQHDSNICEMNGKLTVAFSRFRFNILTLVTF
jgi:hypothetical protein